MSPQPTAQRSSVSPSNLPEIKDKLRFLCLHGYRQNGDSFKAKIGSFRKSIARYAEFVFVSAPHVAPSEEAAQASSAGCPPNRAAELSWWFNKADGTFAGKNRSGPADGFEESVKLVENVWKGPQGPFHGLLGFSQGGCFVGLLCGLVKRGMTTINPKFAIIAAGFQSSSLVHLPYYEDQIGSIRSMHIMGSSDAIIPHEMSEVLSEMFADAVLVRHGGGHYFAAGPEQKTVYADTVSEWLIKHLEREELRRAVAEVDDNDGDEEQEEEEEEEDLQERVVRKTKKKQPRPPTSSDDSY